ncbi:MAG TPA: HAD family hydrolase [Thermoplasmata archaeon]|nr:HAD family hydrolase [Thermoplasmata archaeon]
MRTEAFPPPASDPSFHRRAVFVDRDGTLNPDLKYLDDPERVELFLGVAAGLRRLRARGFRILCITNQSGIERGFYSREEVDRIHARINEKLARAGARVDGFYYCPHAPETGCDCRKPGTRLFEEARTDWGLDFAGSAIIGDRSLDLEAGEKLGLVTALVLAPGHVEEVEREIRERKVAPDILSLTFTGAVRRLLGSP